MSQSEQELKLKSLELAIQAQSVSNIGQHPFTLAKEIYKWLTS